MAIQEATGTVVSLATTLPTTFDDNATTGYPGASWTVIGNITQVPGMGSVSNEVTLNPLGEIDVIKRPGSRNHGSVNLPMALDSADAGQTAALGAVRTEIALRVVQPNGNAHYSTGYILSFTTEVGGSDNIIMANLGVTLTRAETRVSA